LLPLVQEKMKALGYNHTTLAQAAHIGRHTVKDWFSGKIHMPRADRVKAIVDVLDIGEPPDTIPLLGDVPAGTPLLVDATSLMEAPRFIFPQARPDWFGVRVSGDSMNLVAQDGYVLVVCPHFIECDLDGKFVIANYNGEVTFKQFRAAPVTMLEPRSTNTLHRSIVPNGDDELLILGVVKFIIADMRG